MAKKVGRKQVVREGYIIIDERLHNVDFGTGMVSVLCYVSDPDSAIRYSMHLGEAFIFNTPDEALESKVSETECVVSVELEEPVKRTDHRIIVIGDRAIKASYRGQRCLLK